MRTYSNTDKIFPTRTIKAGGKPYPLPVSDNVIKALTFKSAGKTYDLPDYVALNRMVGLLILKDGKIVFEHYDFGFTPKTRWMSMSIAKSFVSTLVGAAVKDKFIASINDPVTKYLPQLAGSAYEKVSVRDVLMMASGVVSFGGVFSSGPSWARADTATRPQASTVRQRRKRLDNFIGLV